MAAMLTQDRTDLLAAAVLPVEQLAQHFDRRLARFAKDRQELLELLAERRLSFVDHDGKLRDLDGLREQVRSLQRRLSEVEVQSVRERRLALQTALDQQELQQRQEEHLANAQRLLAAMGSHDVHQEAGSAASPSHSVVRLVSTPNDVGADEDAKELKEVWKQIQAVVQEHREVIATFDDVRKAKIEERDAASAKLRCALAGELEALQEERLRLAFALEGYTALRAQDAASTRQWAEELDELNTRSAQLSGRAEGVLRNSHLATHLDVAAKVNAGGHAEFRRRAEVLERQGVTVLCQDLEATQQTMDRRAADISAELQRLRHRCDSHRQHRRLALEGFRADISLLRKKLAMLEAVALEATGSLVCAASEGHAGSRGFIP